ncbi:unnamed protein product [Leptidea sinapis]|uniref:Phosphoinositide phospholipase C n=1 Tax=Leptidea sinapis TaxID=189913 RepID=A0A5E4QYW2_9NEOP|nr:unnamed protein product [Leptidea sinapis]
MEDKTGRTSLSMYHSPHRGEGDGEAGGTLKQGARKRSNQVARELSDMVTYVQAIKFRGLNPLSPRSSVRESMTRNAAVSSVKQQMMKEAEPGSSFESSESSDSTATQSTGWSRRVAPQHPCYRCSSVNEAIAKKICRKHPLALVAHTESQLVRTYPAGLRIDSSNFDPVLFWSCGVQLVALNYQTEDAAMALNGALFEAGGARGYVRKPRVMWDPHHIAYRRFNPMEKEFEGILAKELTLRVVSGQYVAECVFSFYNVYVHVEVAGVPADCCRARTGVARRNALNPVWDETFHFKVFDADTNYMLSQRVIPATCLRPGYRHVRLRSPTNQPLNMASLLIFSRCSEEQAPPAAWGSPSAPPARRKLHFVVVHAPLLSEPSCILKVTHDTTADEAIGQVLSRAGAAAGSRAEYVLVEEVAGRSPSQRVLAPRELVLGLAPAASRLLLKRVGDDPSSRAWLTSIRSASAEKAREPAATPGALEPAALERPPDNFLVCVHNVCHEIPYAILKQLTADVLQVPLSATASYVIHQALTKARCTDDPKRFVLVELLEWGGRSGVQQRTLAPDELVYEVQASWKTLGRFLLQEKGSSAPLPRHRACIARIQRGLSITRGAITVLTIANNVRDEFLHS